MHITNSSATLKFQSTIFPLRFPLILLVALLVFDTQFYATLLHVSVM